MQFPLTQFKYSKIPLKDLDNETQQHKLHIILCHSYVKIESLVRINRS
jgi:hypothetical protein